MGMTLELSIDANEDSNISKDSTNYKTKSVTPGMPNNTK